MIFVIVLIISTNNSEVNTDGMKKTRLDDIIKNLISEIMAEIIPSEYFNRMLIKRLSDDINKK